MFIKFATTTLFSLSATFACCDEPALVQRSILPPAVGSMAPSNVERLPVTPANTTLSNETNNVRGGRVETRVVDGKHTLLLTERSQIEHSSQANGSFTVSANSMRFSIPSDAFTKPDTVSLSDLEATGTCAFATDSIRISANQMAMKTIHKIGRSTLLFDGDVVISANGLTASADSVSLTRVGTTWVLSGVLTAPQDGG